MTSVTHIRGNGSVQPPPVKKASKFANPLGNDESDEEEVEVEKPPPPDIIDSVLAKQLDAFGLLLRNTYSSTNERHCAGLPLPKELLQSVDVGWVITGTRHHHQGGVTTPRDNHTSLNNTHDGDTMPKLNLKKEQHNITSPAKSTVGPLSPRKMKGHKSLENIDEHRTESILIDSPRSVIILIKNGISPDALKKSDDPMVEARRKRIIAQLQTEYTAQADKTSQHCIVEYLRNSGKPKDGLPQKRPLGYVSPAVRRQARGASPSSGEDDQSSPERHHADDGDQHQQRPQSRQSGHSSSKLPAAMSPTQLHQKRAASPNWTGKSSTGRRSPQLSPRVKRAKPRNLQRLLQHRDHLMAEWGLRQQKLVNDAYQVARVEKLKLEHSKKQTSPSPSRNRRSETAPLVTNMHSRTASESSKKESGLPQIREQREQRTSQTSLTVSSPSPTNSKEKEIKTTRQITEEAAARRRERIAELKKHQKELEAERRESLDQKLREKERIAEECALRRAEKQKEVTTLQQAKAKKVKEVNDRMKRSEAYNQLQLVRQMEEEAERHLAREATLEQERRAIQEEHRRRNCLEYETRQFMHQSNMMLEKMMCQQETQARRTEDYHLRNLGGPTAAQRKLKEESRRMLKKVLKHEDEIINEWKSIDSETALQSTVHSAAASTTSK